MQLSIYSNIKFLKMNKLFFIIAIAATLFAQETFAQDNQVQTSPLLISYYSIKNALVAGNSDAAAASATTLLQAIDSITSNTVTPDKLSALKKDANTIKASKDIQRQRESFAGLSANMLSVVKANPLTMQPVYALYCPMKKSYWLSSDNAIKNPYFGNAMLTCGEVSETISQ